MTAAAFKACYAEWKVIKTRATVQLVFELPIEQADEAYQALGGMPIAAKEVWCGIARLDAKKLAGSSAVERGAVNAVVEGSIPSRSAKPDKERRTFSDIAPAQQAGMLCQERAFRLFLAEKFEMEIPDPDEAAAIVRDQCGVKSRSEITKDNAYWSSIVLAYRLWQNEPSVVPA